MHRWIIILTIVAVLAVAAGYFYGSRGNDEVLVNQSANTAAEGIKVHGDWEVTVSGPETDEEMVYSFSNELIPYGQDILTLLLKGEGFTKADDGTNEWEIIFEFDGSCTFCTGAGAADTALSYPEAPSQWTDFEGLQMTASYIVQSGSDELVKVHTALRFDYRLAPSLEGSNIPALTYPVWQTVTSRELDPPIPVAAGQLVAATVHVTFE